MRGLMSTVSPTLSYVFGSVELAQLTASDSVKRKS